MQPKILYKTATLDIYKITAIHVNVFNIITDIKKEHKYSSTA